MKYALIKRHEQQQSARRMRKVVQVHPGDHKARKTEPQCLRAKDDQRLTGLFEQAWLESGGVYGHRKLTLDTRNLGERCGKYRVARLLKRDGLRPQTGYRRRPGVRGSKPAVVAPNHLQRRLATSEPNQSRVTDITYIGTHKGWLYLAVVVDLFSHQVLGRSMSSPIDTSLVLNVPLLALWHRQQQQPVMVHSDQGCQFTGHEWQALLCDHNLICRMSRRGNCHDNAAAESLFQLLKRDRIRRQVYATRNDTPADVFNYIEMFCYPKRHHFAGRVRAMPFPTAQECPGHSGRFSPHQEAP